ncbi:hypothetical protein SLEP1_g30792 [Rubroshorea leprosula]|uniref:DUF4219 domain-containing protein n=1 Tax=Rubroshorea leprosula TaxID=152421 RepID=A0AAV5K9B6_9ROSI|nr:hypothetical protein SLEP1_g30792 [Rubroshorea leprosula]
METATLPPNTIVPEVFGEYNYERWSILIEHYLVAQDVWDVIEPIPTTEEINERVWNKQNALALHAIKISCGAKAFRRIKNIQSARDAWQALLDMSEVSDIPRGQEFIPPRMDTREEEELQSMLHEYIYNGSKRGVKQVLNLFPDPGYYGVLLFSALHVAVTAGKEDLARFFLERNPVAAYMGAEDVFVLLERCITKKMFQIVWELLNFYPNLATDPPPQGHMPIILTLAKASPPFFRGSKLKSVRLWIYHCMEVNVDLIRPRNAANVDLIRPRNAAHGASGEEPSCYQSCLQFLKALPRKPVTTLSKILGKLVTTLLKILGKLVTPLLKILGKQPRLRKINY